MADGCADGGAAPPPISEPGSRLRVAVLRAAGLPPSPGGAADVEAYCACRLQGRPRGGFETEQVALVTAGGDGEASSAEARWASEPGEVLGYERGDALEFEVCGCSDAWAEDAPLGVAVLAAAEFDREGGFDGSVTLALREIGASGGGAGGVEAAAGAPLEASVLAVHVEVLPPKQEMDLPEVESVGGIASSAAHELRGREVEVGPAVVYVSGPLRPLPPPPCAARLARRGDGEGAENGDDAEAPAPAAPVPASASPAPARPTDCVLIAHDRGTLRDGRYRQLADAFASQGWLAVVPDFAANRDQRDVWFDAIRLYCTDYLFPWLEEDMGIEAMICVGFGTGALPCAYVGQGGREHLQGGATVPRLVGTLLAYPELKKPYVLHDGEFQKRVALMAPPTLVMPVHSDPKDVRRGGLLEFQAQLLDRPIEFMEFAGVARGFLEHGDLADEEVRTSVTWAADAAGEFCHRNFEASLSEPWRVEHRAPPRPPPDEEEDAL